MARSIKIEGLRPPIKVQLLQPAHTIGKKANVFASGQVPHFCIYQFHFFAPNID